MARQVEGPEHESRPMAIRGVIGPVFSNHGLKNWFLYVTDEGLFAVPVTFWITVKAGLWAGLGSPSQMNAAYNAAKPLFAGTIEDTGDRRWRRYRRAEIRKLEARRALLSANEIWIQGARKRADVYGIGDRAATDAARRLLFEVFSDVYTERGFPDSLAAGEPPG